MASEAEEYVKKAQKSLKTSLLKWSPDIDSAIDFYGKAAVIYRNLRKLNESADLYLQIADLHMKNGSNFHCAKSYETASLLFRDLGDFGKLVECVEKAGKLLRQNGVPDSAASLYDKGGKALETKNPEKSAYFYEQAADCTEVEEKYLQAADFAGRAARVCTSHKRYDEASRLLRYQMNLCALGANNENQRTAYQVCGKAVIALVVIELARDDSVAANKVFNEAVEKYHFNDTDDFAAVARLLQAVDAFDSTAAAEIIKMPSFRTLETEYARLVRSIKFPSSGGVSVSGVEGEIATTDDDGTGDIC